jgi:cyclopropane-fatty-acyl-phospholipid synthase
MAKVEHVLRKAQLVPGQTLLDVGSGWGTLLIEAARRFGVRAHGITLSREQCAFTRERIRAEGLEGRVSVELLDYRELAARGRSFDRIVTVGMMEHVGRKNLPVFMDSLRHLLKPGGVAVLHSMTRLRECETSPWIRKHVFPGCYVPSWRELAALFPAFGFHLLDAESLRRHYALTLTRWADRFETRLDQVRALGFDKAFIRMWRLYLRGCAASFQSGLLDLHQWVVTRGINNDLPLTRQSW